MVAVAERRYTDVQQAWIDDLMRVLRNVGEWGTVQIDVRPKKTPKVLVLRGEVKMQHQDTQGADWLV